jgi:hypothetical protein
VGTAAAAEADGLAAADALAEAEALEDPDADADAAGVPDAAVLADAAGDEVADGEHAPITIMTPTASADVVRRVMAMDVSPPANSQGCDAWSRRSCVIPRSSERRPFVPYRSSTPSLSAEPSVWRTPQSDTVSTGR